MDRASYPTETTTHAKQHKNLKVNIYMGTKLGLCPIMALIASVSHSSPVQLYQGLTWCDIVYSNAMTHVEHRNPYIVCVTTVIHFTLLDVFCKCIYGNQTWSMPHSYATDREYRRE